MALLTLTLFGLIGISAYTVVIVTIANWFTRGRWITGTVALTILVMCLAPYKHLLLQFF